MKSLRVLLIILSLSLTPILYAAGFETSQVKIADTLMFVQPCLMCRSWEEFYDRDSLTRIGISLWRKPRVLSPFLPSYNFMDLLKRRKRRDVDTISDEDEYEAVDFVNTMSFWFDLTYRRYTNFGPVRIRVSNKRIKVRLKF